MEQKKASERENKWLRDYRAFQIAQLVEEKKKASAEKVAEEQQAESKKG
jgi:hypothetical protein